MHISLSGLLRSWSRCLPIGNFINRSADNTHEFVHADCRQLLVNSRAKNFGFAHHLSAQLLMLCIVLCWSTLASAQHTSVECPPQTGTVSSGGTVTINISDCAVSIGFAGIGAVDGGSFGPADFPNHGSAIARITGGQWFLDYSHNGTTGIGATDVFELSDASSTGSGDVLITITITPSASPITVAPASLPTLTAGALFLQTLTSSGGLAPYGYTLQSGVLPLGLTLTSGGILSGTPTQRGAYSFSVRSRDATTPTAQSVDKGYTGTVQNPTLALVAASATAIQGAAFSQTLSTAGGVAPYSYLLETGSFPAGISISSAGVVSGTTAAATGNYSVVLRVTDASTGPGSYFEVENFTLTVSLPPSVTIAVSPASVAEDGASNLVYTVTRSLNLSSPTVVNIATGGTATSGTDYTGGVATVTIPSGATTATITVNPSADTTVEADESVILTVAAGIGYTVGAPSSAIGTILNDDLPSLTINDVTANEGNAGTSNFTFTVSLSVPAGPGGVTFNIATADGTATAGSDYTARSLTGQTIPAGSSTYTFTVLVNGDALNELNETFFVNVTGVSNAVVVDGQGIGTITNDDALPTISTSNVAVTEGNSGTANAVVTVTLSVASGQTVSVNYATADGSAIAPGDYTAATGTLIFTSGQTSRNITLLVNGDITPEANETFSVGLFGAVNSTIGVPTSFITITNDDVPVTLSPATLPNGQVDVAYTQTITASGGTAPYTFALTAGALPVSLTLLPGGTLSGTPTVAGIINFTITATDSSGAPGPYSGSQVYNVTISKANQAALVAASTSTTLNVSQTATLSTTGGSGIGGVTFASNNANCTIVGTTLTAAAAGNCIVTATKALDANYNLASATVNITTSTAPQTITFGAQGAQTFAPSATFSLSPLATASSGLAVAYSSTTTGICTVNALSGLVTIVSAGACTIAANQAGNGAFDPASPVTQSITINAGSQTIAFGANPGSVNFSTGGTFNVLATATSTLAVAITIPVTTAVCSISGNTVTMLSAGTCTVMANQPGNTNFSAASQVAQSIIINTANQTIAFGANPGPANFSIGGTLNVAATGGASGNTVTFSIPVTTTACSVLVNTVTMLSAGTCTVAANQAGNANFNAATQVTQSITINTGSQTISFGANPGPVNFSIGGTFNAAATGGASGNTVTFSIPVTTTVCSVAGNIVTTLSAGTCTVAANQAGNASFNAAPQVTQSITINQASQTISFGANPGPVNFATGGTFNVAATGGASGNAVTFSIPVTTTVCSVAGNTVTMLGAGICTVAADQAGNTSFSAASQVTQLITINQASQTISFGANPGPVNFATGGTFNVAATATSALTVAFSVPVTTAVCSVSGSTVTLLGAGTCTVTANQAGNTSFSAAPLVTQSITINLGSQTITFGANPGPVSFANGGTFNVSAPATSALTVAFAVPVTSAVCSVSGNTVTMLSAGTCTVAATQAGNANFNAASQVTQSITVNIGSQTIAFGANPGPVAFTTGGTFNISATATSALAVAFTITVTTTVCSVSGNTVSILSAGICTVVANQAGNANFNAASQVTQSITINQASQTITFAPVSLVVVGVAPIALAASTSSGLTGFTFATASANTICTVAGNQLTIVGVGTCALTATQVGNTNYTAASAMASITINQGAQTITFAPVSSLVSTAPPFVVTATGGSSGNPVTFASQTTAICTSGGMNGATITLSGTLGICTVRASQASTANYTAAANVDRSITVVSPIVPTATRINLIADPAMPVIGQTITITASIVGANPTGSVSFSEGSVVMCSNVALFGGSTTAGCAVPLANRGVGSHTYIATYGGDGNNTGAQVAISVVVSASTSSTFLTALPQKPRAGDSVTLTAYVSGSLVDGGVSFIEAGIFFPGCERVAVRQLPGTTDGGVATCTVASGFTAGIHTVLAAYVSASNNLSSRTSLELTVLPRGPIDYSDMWWAGQAENGWGMTISQKGLVQFNAFYVYDNAGKPTWYVMPGGTWNADFTRYTGLLYQPTSAPFDNYDASRFAAGASVGNATLTFTTTTTATFVYTINGVNGSKNIVRQPFGSPDGSASVVVNDLWWGGSFDSKQNGWGLAVAQQVRQLFMVWFTYGQDGKPVWYVIPGGSWTGAVFTGDLYSTTGSAWLGVNYNPALMVSSKAGTLTLNFTNPNSATMSYTVNGVTQTKPISRQPF